VVCVAAVAASVGQPVAAAPGRKLTRRRQRRPHPISPYIDGMNFAPARPAKEFDLPDD